MADKNITNLTVGTPDKDTLLCGVISGDTRKFDGEDLVVAVVNAVTLTNFTSTGIDDNASKEVLALSDVLATIGAPLDISAANAGQITFPATQNASADANTLDGYEEGTFTPGLTFGGGSTGLTWLSQAAYYTKIGRVIFAQIQIALTAKGSSTGSAVITGLPFTAAGSIPTPVSLTASHITSGVGGIMLTGWVNTGATAVDLYHITTGTQMVWDDADFTDNTQIRISAMYHA